MLKTLLWDMDGVLANWCKHVCDTFGHDYDDTIKNWNGGYEVADQFKISEAELWSRIDKISDWWETIPPYEWLPELLKIAKHYPSYICSAPSRSPNCVSGKVKWLKQHTKFDRNIVLTPHKWLLAKENTILIDDSDKKIDDFKAAGGNTILFPQPWNSGGYHPEPAKYVIEQILRIGGDD